MQTVPQVSPSVTVVVCTRDRPDRLADCLLALRKQSYPCFDILVVDNASSRPVAKICESFDAASVRAPNPGLTRARNVGARVARGEIIAYVDDDAIVEPGWLEALVAEFRDPAVGAVSGRIRYMKSIDESRAISGEDAPGERPRPRGRFDLKCVNWFTTASFGGVGDGGNMAFRRKIFAAGTSFDERLGRGRTVDSGDEHMLFASLIARGHAIVHNPEAVVRHPGPATPEMRSARRWPDLRSSISYLAFVWSVFPQHRAEILAFIGRALAKRMTFAWISGSATAWFSGPCAILAGVLAYLRARQEWEGPSGDCAVKPADSLPRVVGSSLER